MKCLGFDTTPYYFRLWSLAKLCCTNYSFPLSGKKNLSLKKTPALTGHCRKKCLEKKRKGKMYMPRCSRLLVWTLSSVFSWNILTDLFNVTQCQYLLQVATEALNEKMLTIVFQSLFISMDFYNFWINFSLYFSSRSFQCIWCWI